MGIAVRQVFEPTDQGVFDRKEHRRLANDFHVGKLPGVRSVAVYRNIDQQIMVGEAILKMKMFQSLGKIEIILLKEKSGGRNL